MAAISWSEPPALSLAARAGPAPPTIVEIAVTETSQDNARFHEIPGTPSSADVATG